MIDGCLEWQRIGLNPPAKVVEASNDYVDAQDMLKQFIEERCEIGPDLSVNVKQFSDAYNGFRAREGMFSLKNGQIVDDMVKKAFLWKRKTLENEKPYCFIGLKLKPVKCAFMKMMLI